MPDLSSLQIFILTSELGSLVAVGRKLGISSAAISKQLTKLEEELGVQLLIRTTRKIELTDIGINYYSQCQRIWEEVEEAAALIAQVKIIPHGQLKVVSARHFATAYITPYVAEFLTLYPQIELNLELAERIPDLNLEAIDVMIGMSIPAIGDAIQRKIATTSYCYCASPSYLKNFGIPMQPNDLKKHRYITHSMRKPDNELLFHHHEPTTVKPYIRVNDAQTMKQFALDGLGIVKVHQDIVRQSLEEGSLIEILTAYKEKEIPIYVAYPQRRFVSSKTRCFIDFILEKITQS